MEEQKLVFFEEIGLLYRKKREEKGLTINDIQDELKLSAEIVRAIENATIANLPRAVYTKGFYRSYGQLLGIDKEVVDAFITTVFMEDTTPYLPKQKVLGNMALEQVEPIVFFENEVVCNQKNAVLRKRLLLLFVLLGIVGSISYCVWTPKKEKTVVSPITSVEELNKKDVANQISSTQQEGAVTPPQQSVTADTSKTNATNIGAVDNTANSNQKTLETQQLSAKSSHAKESLTEAQPVDESAEITIQKSSHTTPKNNPLLQQKQVTHQTTFATEMQGDVASVQQQNSSAIQEEVSKETPTTQSKEEKITFIANARVWIAIEYEGEKTDFFLNANEQKTVEFNGGLSAKIGDLAAVTIEYNGEKLQNLGKVGSVGTYTFDGKVVKKKIQSKKSTTKKKSGNTTEKKDIESSSESPNTSEQNTTTQKKSQQENSQQPTESAEKTV